MILFGISSKFGNSKIMVATLLVLVLCVSSQCGSRTKTGRQITRSFYFWKSVFDLNPQQAAGLKQLNITRLYVKLFDVDWLKENNTAAPLATLRFEQKLPDTTDIVPVIYITNNTFKNLPDTLVPALADSIYRKMQTILKTWSIKTLPTEIQFDCDWTVSTKQKYFAFLQAFKNKAQPAQPIISATIRLHQVKYTTQSGIPPVDRGMLMFYNMGNFKDAQTTNSILDLKVAKAYLPALNQYPLPLDVALPLFSWGVAFRNRHFVNLINQLNTATANSQPQLLQPIGNMHYRVLKSGMINGSQVGKNDIIRIEEISKTNCIKSVRWLSQHLNTPGNLHVAFYHLYPNVFQHYPHTTIDAIFNTFQ